jgi:hypothetical protein
VQYRNINKVITVLSTCNAHFSEVTLTFHRNMLPPFSGSKDRPSMKPVRRRIELLEYVPLKHWVTPQKTAFFVVTAERTSNPTVVCVYLDM